MCVRRRCLREAFGPIHILPLENLHPFSNTRNHKQSSKQRHELHKLSCAPLNLIWPFWQPFSYMGPFSGLESTSRPNNFPSEFNVGSPRSKPSHELTRFHGQACWPVQLQVGRWSSRINSSPCPLPRPRCSKVRGRQRCSVGGREWLPFMAAPTYLCVLRSTTFLTYHPLT